MMYKETIEWHPIKTRRMTDAEKIEYSETYRLLCEEFGYTADALDEEIIDGELPEEGETVLIKTNYGVYTTTFYRTEDAYCYFDDYDSDEIIAWASMPKGEF